MKRYFLFFAVITSLAVSQSPVPAGAVLEKIAAGFQFVEGPVWKDGVGLLFSDINPSIIYQWSKNDSLTTIYLKPSDSSNGLAFDKQGNLILTQMLKRRISRQESNRTITPLASTFNGKKFNSPNDLCVKSDGSIFFTDPDWNTPAGQAKEMGFQGVFRISPTGTLSVLDSTKDASFDKPNGICFSPDEKKLYVNASSQGRIYVYDVVNDSTLSNKKVLNTTLLGGYGDGMKADSAGNIYCAGPGGIWIFSPTGTYLGKINVPESARNCAWGDADRKTLYITAGKSIYRIRLAVITKVKSEGSLQPNSYKLYANFPNPFNPSTQFQFAIPALQFVSLKIFNVVGKEIATIVSEWKDAGSYFAYWDASQYASGTYYYRLRAGEFSETRRMVLMK